VLALQPADKSEKHKVQRYSCSNPNCKRVFSRPKIIKYYVCPTCQTVVNMTQTDEQGATQEKPSPPKKLVTRAKPKAIEQVKSEEPKEKELMISPPLAVMKGCAQTETELDQKPKKLEQAQKQEPNVAELSPNQQSTPKDETTVSSSSPGCEYGFGYLSQREKRTEIPETCVTCPKSLDCMLSEYYNSEETVKEIKKWYQL
jgi:hypothetical protein